MTFTIWSSAGRFEYLIYADDQLIERSGLIYRDRRACKRAVDRATIALTPTANNEKETT